MITGGRGGRQDDYFGTQLHAGTSLAHILGGRAIPLLNPRLRSANPSMAEAWIDVVKQTKHTYESAVVVKLTQSKLPGLRAASIDAITDNGGAKQVHKHMEWLVDRSADIRYRAIRCLAESGDPRDVPVLRRATVDSDDTVRLWGLRGIVRFAPPDIDAILRRMLREHPDNLDVRVELARRGDQGQLRWCVNTLSRFADAWRRDHRTAYAAFDGTHLETAGLQELAKVVVHHRPAGTRVVLTKIAALPGNIYNGARYFQCIGFGGLAVLGDPEAHVRVRALTADHDPFTVVYAIEWLAIANDRESAPLLRTLLTDREVMIRDASRKALAAMKIPEKEPIVVASPRVASGVRTGGRPRGAMIGLGALLVVALLFVRVKGPRSYRR